MTNKHTDPNRQDPLFMICPFTTTSRVVSGKWAVLVLHFLKDGPKRFGQLKKLLPGIAETTLTKQLRQLEKDKLIERETYPEVPPRVEYRLSQQGEAFKKVLDSIEEWGTNYIEFLEQEETRI